MKNWKRSAVVLAMLAAMSIVHETSGQSTQPRTSSAQSSQSSGIRADRNGGSSAGEPAAENRGDRKADSPAENRRPIRACAAAVEELIAGRRLIEALAQENALLKERLDTERRTSSLLAELNDSRRAEMNALRNAIEAKNETIRAKDTVVATQETLIETLKARRSSPWKRLGDVLIGIAAGAVLR